MGLKNWICENYVVRQTLWNPETIWSTVVNIHDKHSQDIRNDIENYLMFEVSGILVS